MLVAEGAAEVMLEIGPTLWDLAAPSLILEEAGGRLTDFAGTRSNAGPQVLASNGRLHDAIVSALAGSERGARSLVRGADGRGADRAGHLHLPRPG